MYHYIHAIYSAVRVAVIFHNRLLAYDGCDKFDWEQCDPEAEEPEHIAEDVDNDNNDSEDDQDAEGEFAETENETVPNTR